MAIEPPPPGSIIDYPYLWTRERDAGETEGRKPRPVCLVISAVITSGEHVIILLAITSQAPRASTMAVEVPPLELRRAGLADHRRGWVIIDEYNADILERSWYYIPLPARGTFSPAFLNQLLKAFRPTLAERGAGVDRQA